LRFNFRVKLRQFTVFIMMSHTQTLEGVTSRVGKNEHLIFWDLENCSLAEAESKLGQIQKEFKLGNIFVTSDAQRSYRAWCFSKRSWIEYMHILIHTFPFLDYGFWVWTVRRGASTLGISNKEGRPPQRVVSFLKGYEETGIPESMVHVIYDTGLEKRGKVVKIG